LDMWLAMDGGCDEVESEGVVVDKLRAETRKHEAQSNQRGYDSCTPKASRTVPT
jgi:hypothetical protein